jgi:hypothetical protein
MALTSPGVEVTITDQSQYLPAPGGSVPLVILATAQNKADASGTGVAAATTAANAGKLYQITSQRDLVNLYGSPFFYSTTNGTPIQGYELNEYGLLAAYSTLGVTNRCYVLRADIDLASLVGQTGRPVGFPENNTYWLDTTSSTWGIYVFNQTTGKFSLQTPIVITNPDDLTGGVPNSTIGNIGNYAVNALETAYSFESDASNREFFYKSSFNVWVPLGGTAWKKDVPTVSGTTSNPVLSPGTFTINLNGIYITTITVPVFPNNNVYGVAAAINNLNWFQLTASVRNNKLCIFSSQNSNLSGAMTLSQTGTVLDELGIVAKTYYQAGVEFGTAAQMPLWTSSQAQPHPTGSVWIKVGQSGNGLAPVVANFNAVTNIWQNKNVSLATSDAQVNSNLDATGGKLIPAGSIYAQYDPSYVTAPLYLWERIATGPTVVTGSVSNPVLNSGPYVMTVQTSVPGSPTLSSVYSVTVPDNTDASGFVTAWTATNILYTTASVTTDGAIQITHTDGGSINLSDLVAGVSNGLLSAVGFNINSTAGCKYGPTVSINFSDVPQLSTTGVGTNGLFNIISEYSAYVVSFGGVGSTGGSGYAVGDNITISGAVLGGTTPTNDLVIKVTSVSITNAITSVMYVSGSTPNNYATELSNWRSFTYTANEGSPVAAPVNDTNWFFSVVDQVDIMVQKGGVWIGYGQTSYDSSGFPAATGVNATDPNGPIIAATAPTTQSDGTALVYGDLWMSTSDLELYPLLSRWEAIDSLTNGWVLLDNSDQVSSSGVVFADARWATSGTVSPTDDPIATIPTLLQSNYLDLDAPTATLYPQGMLLFNTRRSGYNVKQYKANYFNSTDFAGDTLPVQKAAWVTISGNQANGSPYMGRKAQRAVVVQAMNAVVATNMAIRDEDNAFNLMAAPNYPELQPNMVVLNNDRGDTGYILGDTPMRLPDDATAIQAWATNAAGATSTGEDGCVTRDTYLGLFYPSGITNDLSGNLVAVPASHMMLRTFIRSDNVSYPWLAAAGTRRGTIDNATNIGYLDGQTGEFQTIKTRIGIRDVLYTNFINPMVFFTGVGLLNYGNKTSFNSSSALDRVNVARLVAYIRRQLTLAARPFVFEPNDALTRQQIAGVVQTLMVDLVAKRGLYDYLVVCDDSNNTPARIDRNELWIDVAIEPVKAAEFIYIPVRILNTGELSGK